MTDLDIGSWRDTLAGEMLLLGLLGQIVYSYPGEKERPQLQALIDKSVFSDVPFAADQAQAKAGIELLQKWEETGLSDDVFAQMQIDYTRLFIGLGRVLAPPWESVYFNEYQLMFQKETLQVRDWYSRFGLQVECFNREPDDHIGIELSFIAHLASIGLQAIQFGEHESFQQTLQAQRDFLSQHLFRWGPAWSKLVKEYAQTDFYRGLAYLTHGALLATAQVLQIEMPKDSTR